MHKAAKLYTLLSVFLVICVAAFAVSQYQEKKENIKNSGEVILEIPANSVTALSWSNESGTFSFTNENDWTYNDDTSFPVSKEKINNMLSQFESFTAAFVIDEVEDYAQYGLDDPVCTILVATDDKNYTIKLGNFSKMDEQRYISIEDGKAYLVTHDPLEEFDAVLRDMILDDTIPEFDTADEIKFTGIENYTVIRNEDGGSVCNDDIFFTEGKPLDTDNVDSYLSVIRSLNLTDYVSYNVTDEELVTFGLNDPDLVIELVYSETNEDENSESKETLLLSLSCTIEYTEDYEEVDENDGDDLPDFNYYIRIGQSQIIYEISQSIYENLTAVSYDTLRHQKLFTADFGTVMSIDVTLDGEEHTFIYTLQEDENADETEGIWIYDEKEFDIYNLKAALCAISASDFTEEALSGQEEISVTIHLDNESFPTVTLTLYRYDGTNCVAAVDGKVVAFVSRSQTVDLIEAVNEVILDG